MRVLSLWQPWASLIELGAKRVETRSWDAASLVGERIAIHAAKTTKQLSICSEEPFSEHLPDPERLPLGAIVCTAVVNRIRRVTDETAAALERDHPREFAFGDYTPGRFAWVLRDVHSIVPPVPFRGKQGIGFINDRELSGAVPREPLPDQALDQAEHAGPTCASCNAPIIWAITPKHQRIPIDLEPADDGNVLLSEHFDGTTVASVTAPGSGTHRSHFATCPFADVHRNADRGGAHA